jgi:two-component system NtrC family response regulator/two-component system response regulator HydG
MTSRINILYVDDDPSYRSGFPRILSKQGDLSVRLAENGRDALKTLDSTEIDIVVTDVMMPGMDGMDLLKAIKIRHPRIFVVVITGFGTIHQAVEAMKHGASDYLLKPFDADAVRATMGRLIEHVNVLRMSCRIIKDKRKTYRFENIIGQDRVMLQVFEDIARVADTDASVLITGESGTGKERVAEAIHYRSLRKEGPFVKVNCAALTETLINSELFGYEKGAFTGADRMKKGHFETADQGTIFLDEIGDVPLKTQVSLLRVLDLRCFQRVGGTRTVSVDTRLICATNQDLAAAIIEKRFREDLFFRINVITISLPPLRERRSDIPILAEYFCRSSSARLGKTVSSLSPSALNILLSYSWPGNVRELSNIMERAVIFAKSDMVEPSDLPEHIKSTIPENSFRLQLDNPCLAEAEKKLIVKVLENRNFNLKKAADDLGIARGTLYGKMERYGLKKPES